MSDTRITLRVGDPIHVRFIALDATAIVVITGMVITWYRFSVLVDYISLRQDGIHRGDLRLEMPDIRISDWLNRSTRVQSVDIYSRVLHNNGINVFTPMEHLGWELSNDNTAARLRTLAKEQIKLIAAGLEDASKRA